MASTHEYRVGKRRMAQYIGLPTSTTVAGIRKEWTKQYKWPDGGPAGFYHHNLDPNDENRVLVEPTAA